MADKNEQRARSASQAALLHVPQQAVVMPNESAMAQQNEDNKLIGEIASLGSRITGDQLARSAALAVVNGKQLVEQGKSLTEIEESDELSGLSIFGTTATMQGAFAQEAVVQSDEMRTQLMQRLADGEFDEMDSTSFRVLTQGMMNSAMKAVPAGTDPMFGALLFESGSKVITEITGHQTKKHYEYVQQRNLNAYASLGNSAISRINTGRMVNNQDEVQMGLADFEARLEKPAGMSTDAHTRTVTQMVLDAYALNIPEAHDLAVAAGISFTPEQQSNMGNAKATYTHNVEKQVSRQDTKDYYALQDSAAQGQSSESAIDTFIMDYNSRNPRSPLSPAQEGQLWKAHYSGQQRATTKNAQSSYLADGQFSMVSDATYDEAMIAQGPVQSQMAFWASNPKLSKMLSNRFNDALSPQLVYNPDGTVNETFVAAMSEANLWAAHDREKFLSQLDDSSKDMFLTYNELTGNGEDWTSVATMHDSGRGRNEPATQAERAVWAEQYDPGLFSWTDSIPFVGASSTQRGETEGLYVARAGTKYSQYRAAGLNHNQATRATEQYMSTNYIVTDGKMRDLGGVNAKEYLGVTDDDMVQEYIEYSLRHEDSSTIFGRQLDDSDEITEWYMGETSNGSPMVYFNVSTAKGQNVTRSIPLAHIRQTAEVNAAPFSESRKIAEQELRGLIQAEQAKSRIPTATRGKSLGATPYQTQRPGTESKPARSMTRKEAADAVIKRNPDLLRRINRHVLEGIINTEE